MRFLLKLFLVSIFGSATVSSLLSGKIKFIAKSTLPNSRRRLEVSTLSDDFVCENKNYPQSDSTWLQVFAEEKKITPAAFLNVLNVNAWRTIFEEGPSTTDNSARKSVGPLYLEGIEGLWRQIRNSGVRRVIKNTIQKVLMFCTFAASMLVIRSQQAFATVAPLSKNVKVRGNEDLSTFY